MFGYQRKKPGFLKDQGMTFELLEQKKKRDTLRHRGTHQWSLIANIEGLVPEEDRERRTLGAGGILPTKGFTDSRV